MLYSLVDNQNTILLIKFFDTQPDDPIGKGWQWTTYTPPAPTLEDTKAAKIVTVKSKYSEFLSQGYSYNDKNIQIDPASQMNIIAASVHALALGTFFPGIDWRAADNTFIRFTTTTDFITFAEGIAQYVEKLRKAMWTHVDAITQLTNIDDVNKYDITTGWSA